MLTFWASNPCRGPGLPIPLTAVGSAILHKEPLSCDSDDRCCSRSRPCLLAAPAGADAAFNPGDFYASFNFSGASVTTNIAHYGPAGAFIDTLSVPGPSGADAGLAYGPDGLLSPSRTGAPTASRSWHSTAVETSSRPTRAAGPTAEIANGIYLGKIAFDNAGHFFVGTFGGLLEYNTGDPNSGRLIYSGSNVNDVRVGNGDILVISDTNVIELSSSGAVVRSIGTPGEFTDLRGLEYDPQSNVIYASMLGTTAGFNQVMKLNFTTGALIASAPTVEPDDLFFTPDRRLVVGSRNSQPVILDANMNQIGSFGTGGGNRLFVTEIATQAFAVPSRRPSPVRASARSPWPAMPGGGCRTLNEDAPAGGTGAAFHTRECGSRPAAHGAARRHAMLRKLSTMTGSSSVPASEAMCRPLNAEEGGPRQDVDPVVAEELLHRLGHVRVFAVDQRPVPLDDRCAATDARAGAARRPTPPSSRRGRRRGADRPEGAGPGLRLLEARPAGGLSQQAQGHRHQAESHL